MFENLTITAEMRYLSTVTETGLRNSNLAIFEGKKILITQVLAGSGRVPEPFKATALASPIPGSWSPITSEKWMDFEEPETGKFRKARVFNGIVANTEHGNNAVAMPQPAYIRELIFMAVMAEEGTTRENIPPGAEQFAYAYAWLPEDEPDINNLLTVPSVPGRVSAYKPFVVPFFLTEADSAILEIIFHIALEGFVRSVNGIGPDENGNVEITPENIHQLDVFIQNIVNNMGLDGLEDLNIDISAILNHLGTPPDVGGDVGVGTAHAKLSELLNRLNTTRASNLDGLTPARLARLDFIGPPPGRREWWTPGDHGNFTVPPGVEFIYITACGGGGGGAGGGGGGGASNRQESGGFFWSFPGFGAGGGGAGGTGTSVFAHRVAVTPGQNISIFVGAGGNFGTGGNGGNHAIGTPPPALPGGPGANGTNGTAGSATVIGSIITLPGGGGGSFGTGGAGAPTDETWPGWAPGGTGGASGGPGGGTGGPGGAAHNRGPAGGGAGGTVGAGGVLGGPGGAIHGRGGGGGAGGGGGGGTEGQLTQLFPGVTGNNGATGMPGCVIIEW